MTDIQPFDLHVPDAVLDDLRERLTRTRLLSDSPRRPWSGLSAAYLAELVQSWVDLDWPERERWLNAHPQFLADVGGTRIHFAHLRSERADAPALLVMHGWPHTFALQLDFANLLPDFHVIVPSFPGFGFSEPYEGPLSERRFAATMVELMTDVLGYETFFTYGEDISANVNDLIAALHPDLVEGIIVTHAHFPSSDERTSITDPEQQSFFERIRADGAPHGGYGHIQGTRPDTLAVGLNDSPAGLLAWLTEKLVEWSDSDPSYPASVERRISRERILTEAMIYWVTQSIATSFRPYYESDDGPEQIPLVEVPAGIFIQNHEGDYPESLAREFYRDLRVFERLDEGGHFAVAEVPIAMADRVRAFARALSSV